MMLGLPSSCKLAPDRPPKPRCKQHHLPFLLLVVQIKCTTRQTQEDTDVHGERRGWGKQDL
jgi:hypothetical protein